MKHRQQLNGPLTVKQVGSLLSRWNWLLYMPCFAAALLTVLPFFLITYRDAFQAKLVSVAHPILLLSAGSAAVALAVGFGFLWLLRKKLRELPVTVSASPCAVEYAQWERARVQGRLRRFWPLLPAIVGVLTMIGAERYLWGNNFYVVFLLELLTLGDAVFLATSDALKRKLYAKFRWEATEDSAHADPYNRRRELCRALLFWGAYWVITAAAYVILSLAFGNWMLYAFIPVAAFAFFCIRMATMKPFRRYASVRGRSAGVLLLNLFAVCGLLLLGKGIVQTGNSFQTHFLDSLDYSVFQSDSRPSISYDTESGVYTLTAAREDFRILQLTDVHISESILTIDTDRKALQTCYDLIASTKPDLVVVTGDIAYAIPLFTFSNNNLSAMDTFANFMNRVGVPWILTYGNHDNEPTSQYRDALAFGGIFRHYQTVGEGAMLYASVQPPVTGRYNQYLRLCNADGSLNRLLFLVDSNDYQPQGGYDWVREDQIAWYADTVTRVSDEEGRIVPSFVFMHIPFRAFADAQDALAKGSSDAVYLHGENAEGVSHPKVDDGFFETIVEKGSTQAVFVGHDHVNNLAVRYREVDLVYSRSIDYVAYPGIASQTAQRGGTLITVHADGSYELESISYTEMT